MLENANLNLTTEGVGKPSAPQQIWRWLRPFLPKVSNRCSEACGNAANGGRVWRVLDEFLAIHAELKMAAIGENAKPYFIRKPFSQIAELVSTN